MTDEPTNDAGLWAVAIAPCWACQQTFGFHPGLVPSIHGEPVCLPCMTAANSLRVQKGLPAIEWDPAAYEPARAEDLQL